MIPGELDLREPLWLWLALFPWLLVLLRTLVGHHRPGGYADRELMPWVTGGAGWRLRPASYLRFGTMALAWSLFAVALAGPRSPQATTAPPVAALPQLVIVLDLSRSMTARDIEPNRIERARLELNDLLLRARNLRIGLVAYAARPHLVAPPTDDFALLRRYLDALRADLMPTEGSDPAAALQLAAEILGTDGPQRGILLVGDGELPDASESREQELLGVVTAVQQKGIRLFTLGVAGTSGTTLLAPHGGWLTWEGEPAVTRLQEERLRNVAARGNGRYATVSDTDSEWRELYDRGIAQLEPGIAAGTRDDSILWNEHFPLPLLLAVLALLGANLRMLPRSSGLVLPVICLAVLLAEIPPARAADDPLTLARRAYAEAAWVDARRWYARVPGYTGRMGEGASSYRADNFRDAIGPFTEALLAANTSNERADALFNLANCHYRLQDYATAIEYYRDVLRYRPDDSAVPVNLGYAEELYLQQLREGDRPASTRPGRGVRSARLADGTEIGQGSVTFDDQAGEPVLPPLPGQGPPLTTDDLIDRGIRYARPASRQEVAQQDEQWVYAPTPVERIELEAAALQVDESLLFKRIFENEEGFAAPQERALTVPGVRPW